MKWLAVLGVALLCTAEGDQDFKRERKPETGANKDALEGKAPPAIAADSWMNVSEKLQEKGLSWKDLKGKVVVIDFWGVW